MGMEKMTHTYTGRIIMSVLLGFGLASMFREICKGNNCLKFKSPNNEKLKDTIYSHGDKCYKFFSHTINCTKDKTYVKS
jgi:hypothetical protein